MDRRKVSCIKKRSKTENVLRSYMMNMLDETSGVEIVNFQSFNLAKYTVSHILILSNKM